MKRLPLIALLLSSLTLAQSPDSPVEQADNQPILENLLSQDSTLRCVPADKEYTHFGGIDDQTIILANKDNDTLLAIVKSSCPRIMDEDRVMILFRKSDGLSNIDSRLCANDAFMLVRESAVSVNNGDSQRACEFREFHPMPIDEALNLVKSRGIVFRNIGVL